MISKIIQFLRENVWLFSAITTISTLLLAWRFILDKWVDFIRLHFNKKIERFITITPVNQQGENIYVKKEDATSDTDGVYIIQARFNIWSKYDLYITNINITYYYPGFQKLKLIVSDNKKMAIDASHNLVGQIKVINNSIVNIRIKSECCYRFDEIDNYGSVKLNIYAISTLWGGKIREISCAGKFAPGGELLVERVAIGR